MTLESPTCLLKGTLIRAEAGEVPIESLTIGDRIQSSITGQFRPIRWIGRRVLDGSALDSEALRRVHLPVRVVRDAFAPGYPAHDLYISPGHALLMDEYGVSVRLLINGTSVAQVAAMDRIEYFHIELDTHDGMIAEGFPVETYLESDNRHAYDNAAEYEALYPGDDPRVQEPCAKVYVQERLVELFRAKVNERAALLGLAETADA